MWALLSEQPSYISLCEGLQLSSHLPPLGTRMLRMWTSCRLDQVKLERYGIFWLHDSIKGSRLAVGSDVIVT